MNPNNYFIFPAILFYLDRNKNFFPFYAGNILANLNQINFLNDQCARNLLPLNLIQTPQPTLNENIQINSNNKDIKNDAKNSSGCPDAQEKKKYFKVIYPREYSLFKKMN